MEHLEYQNRIGNTLHKETDVLEDERGDGRTTFRRTKATIECI
jgi:hypothetical protein